MLNLQPKTDIFKRNCFIIYYFTHLISVPGSLLLYLLAHPNILLFERRVNFEEKANSHT